MPLVGRTYGVDRAYEISGAYGGSSSAVQTVVMRREGTAATACAPVQLVPEKSVLVAL